MSKPRKKKRRPKRVLALEQSKAAVLNSLTSESGQRTYDLRRTCARLCRLAGGELDQSSFCSVIPRSEPQSVTSGASRSCALPSTTGSVSSRRNAQSRSRRWPTPGRHLLTGEESATRQAWVQLPSSGPKSHDGRRAPLASKRWKSASGHQPRTPAPIGIRDSRRKRGLFCGPSLKRSGPNCGAEA
jgi:hypothetical protein